VKLPRLIGGFFPTSLPPVRAGFAEAPLAEVSLPAPVVPPLATLDDDAFPERPGASLPSGVSLPFPSTGPQGHRARMREKLLERGPDSFADYELLEMLLYFAFKQGDTKPLAKQLINEHGSFAAVLTAPQRALMDTRGLGTHSVAALKLVHAAALRLARAEIREKPLLGNWDRLMEYLQASLAREQVEHFRVLYLDTRNNLIADETHGRGTVNHTPVYPREVCKRALELGASALILVHNHPSGDPTPSKEDVAMTREIKQAMTPLGLVLHDHVIVGNGKWTSLKQQKLF
jgi:DNA repair protein RadC